MKKFLLLLTAIICAATASASGQWRIFNTFDSNIEKVADTPDRTYFLCLGQDYIHNVSVMAEKKGFLFVYDKENDEFSELNASNLLSNTLVRSIDYNPYRRYLLVAADNGDIDLLYDNGEVARIKAIAQANVSGEKRVNSVTFDPSRPYAYIATGFGTVTINDEKGEVASSFTGNVPVLAFTRIGDLDIIATEDVLYTAPAGRPHFSLDDFTPCLDIDGVTDFLPLGENDCAVAYGPQGRWNVDFIDIDGDGNISLSPGVTISRHMISHNEKGHYMALRDQFVQINNDRTNQRRALPESVHGLWSSSWDGNEVWFAQPRLGFFSMKQGDDREWLPAHSVMTPNSPAVMTATGMTYDSHYGVLANTRRIDRNFTNFNAHFRSLLSGWKDGLWTNYSPAWLYPERTDVAIDPNGITIDVDNPEYAYMGSYESGIIRLNLSNPNDILHMTHPGDADAGKPGYVKIVETIDWFPQLCNFVQPKFDNDGNLWTIRAASRQKDKMYLEVYVWPAEARRASTSADTFRPWTVYSYPDEEMTNFAHVLPLRSSRARNVVVIVTNAVTPGGDNLGTDIYLLDNKGTIDNHNDDVLLKLDTFIDQDGTSVQFDYILDVHEDLSTGLVWVGTTAGVFTLDPLAQTSTTAAINRIKVSRNDGTSLADYLLNDARVSRIIDVNGKKWFALDGGGIVVASSDGRQVLREIATSNSELPSDKVYDLCYNPESNSMMISTGSGMAEYYMSGAAGSGEDLSGVRIYPNPVRPDYFGYVTIDGLIDNALVKIIDAGGNTVKELGLAEDGEVKWDVTNLNMKRVRSGVYYVLSSTGPDQSNKANVGKVLVVN